MAAVAARLGSRFRKPKPAPVLINGKPIRFRAFQKVAWPVGVGFILGLVIAGLYFGLTQVNWYIHIGGYYQHLFWFKPWWDENAGQWLSQHLWFMHMDQWSAYRHNYRNLGEPAAATVGIFSIVAGAKRTAPKWLMFAAPFLLVISGAVLITFATWLELISIDHLHAHGIYIGTLSLIEAGVLGFFIGRVQRGFMKPFGTTIQRIWVEWGADRHQRRGRAGLPAWISLPLAPVTAREEGVKIIEDDRVSGEAAELAAKPLTFWSHLIWVAVALVLLAILGLAFLGFIGHIWVGVLGHNFPYLAP